MRSRRRGLTRTALGFLVLAAACSTTPANPPTAPDGSTAAPPSTAAVLAPGATAGITTANAPEWRPGDRWTYGWTSGTEGGTKIAEVLENRVISGVAYYLVRIGDLDHYYTHDLGWAAGVRDQKVEARMVPPEPWFVWPLEVGRHWDHHGTFEQRNASTPRAEKFVVAGLEMVEVPAGRYQAFKIAHETDQRDSDEYWYAPDVRWYVRWIGRRGDQSFEERLKSYDRGPGAASAPAAPAR